MKKQTRITLIVSSILFAIFLSLGIMAFKGLLPIHYQWKGLEFTLISCCVILFAPSACWALLRSEEEKGILTNLLAFFLGLFPFVGGFFVGRIATSKAWKTLTIIDAILIFIFYFLPVSCPIYVLTLNELLSILMGIFGIILLVTVFVSTSIYVKKRRGQIELIAGDEIPKETV